MSHVLNPGDSLQAGQSLVSETERFSLVMQADGNLVLKRGDIDVLWDSHTDGKGATFAIMQTDGNFVVRNNERAVWSTFDDHTGLLNLRELHAGAALILQNDGNLVLYYPKAIWATGTDLEAQFRAILGALPLAECSDIYKQCLQDIRWGAIAGAAINPTPQGMIDGIITGLITSRDCRQFVREKLDEAQARIRAELEQRSDHHLDLEIDLHSAADSVSRMDRVNAAAERFEPIERSGVRMA
jgi:hypothetical protein